MKHRITWLAILYVLAACSERDANLPKMSLASHPVQTKEVTPFTRFFDGAYPVAPLINISGALYGTTSALPAGGDGIVFRLTTDGQERELNRFKEGGAYPESSLLNIAGIRYGTTTAGGGGPCSLGCGTVYSITLNQFGAHQLYVFRGSPDGAQPRAALIDFNGTLYSTTYGGGTYGYGTVFSLTTGGQDYA